jgi:hypothetical protein
MGPRWWDQRGVPEFAGIVAIADQSAGKRLGLINPALYRLQAEKPPGIMDVTQGNNTARFPQDGRAITVTGYSAKPGYDLGLVLILVVVRYYWRGDPTWKIDFGGSIAPAETLTFFELVCASEAPVDPRTLGAVECVIRTPAGRVRESDVGEHSLRINPMGIIARFPIDPDPGTYHVRWNAGHHVGTLHEVARAKVVIGNSDEGDTMSARSRLGGTKRHDTPQ